MNKIINHIYLLPLFIAAVLSIRSITQKWAISYRVFSVLLASSFLVELTAVAWRYFLVDTLNWPYSFSTIWLYNSFLIPKCLLYISVYYYAIRSVAVKRMIIITAILLTLFAVINFFFLQPVGVFKGYTIVIPYSIIIFLSIIYFDQLLKQKEIIRLRSHPMVWISLGTFLFHISVLPYLISLNYLTGHYISLALSLYYISLVSSCIMYFLYSIAFLCNNHQHRQ